MTATLLDLVDRKPAPVVRPWVEGYEHAERVREALGWGIEPVPHLPAWLRRQRVSVGTARLPASVSLVASRSTKDAARSVVNSAFASRLRREIGHAATLGHLLLDVSPVAVEGTWEDWPNAARARAFGVMLLLPSEGVRDALGKTRVDTEAVRRVMDRFNVGPHATTFHLRNLGFCDDERRVAILAELVA
jgi:hypothetical protein